jgi:PKD repeat protein
MRRPSCFAALVAGLAIAAPALARADALATFAVTARPQQRMRLLESLLRSDQCYAWPETDAELEALIEETSLLPIPLINRSASRYWVDIRVWQGDPAALGFPDQAVPAHLTYSFPDDGTTWGAFGRPTGPNVLNNRLMSTFGASDLDEGREYIRQGLACYTRHSGLTYHEVDDDNTPMTNSTVHVATRGDVRIGCVIDACSCVAYDGFPSSVGIVAPDGGGSDMVLNAQYWDEPDTVNNFKDPADSYRWLRNVIVHEHGHGIGAIHSVPCNETKQMEPFITVAYDMLQTDDRRGVARSYGDRFAGNHSSATAVNLGTLDPRGVPESVILRHLSLNGVAGAGNTDEDWFRFTILDPRDIDVTASPLGGSYIAAQQDGQCTGVDQLIEATDAGNLAITLYASNAFTVIASANAGTNGDGEAISVASLAAGTYYLRVRDAGPNDATDQFVQLYSLTLRVDDDKAPPVAIAGIHKRVQAGKNCWFMGDINSYTTDSAFPLINAIHTYAWDRDGDGVFEVANAAKTAIQYVSNGVYPVTLRVTDLFGSDTDTINVTVWGATTLVTSVSPNAGYPGQSVPVTINGTNLKNVTSLSHINPGPGITDSGAPDPNTMGTQVSGVTFNISPSAAPGPRNVAVSNADGSASGFMTFHVLAPPICPGDANNDGTVTFADISGILTYWGFAYAPGSNGLGDANDDGAVNFSDVTEVLTFWGLPCP